METTAPTPTPRSRRRWRRYAVWALGLVLACLGGLATYAVTVGPSSGTLDWDWSIAERYGRDADGDGIVDNPDGIRDRAADQRWIQQTGGTITIDTCASPAVSEREGVITGFDLTLKGPQYPTGRTFAKGTGCRISHDLTQLGSYEATVDIKVGPTVVDSKKKTIEPKDLLIVSVGDSVASGEGNPDLLDPNDWLRPKWQNAQCHRTSLAGPAQAALRMERRDPHTSITFVHVACSGASITEGLLGAYDGQDPSKGTRLAPQLDQVRDLVGTRPIDAMTVSIGANDAKFSEVVKACLLQSDCSKTGPGDTGKVLFERERGNIERNYALLDARLDRMARQQAGDAQLRGPVFVTQYFDVTKADSGAYCTGQTPGEVADRVETPYGNTNGMTATELMWADTDVQDGLNTHVLNGINAANGTNPTTGAELVFVDGIKPIFAKNGYCANDRYVRTLAESFLYQRGYDGAFHPNVEGHLYAYAKQIEADVAPALGIGGTALPFENPQAEQLGDALTSWMGYLDRTGGLDAALGALPLGARDKVQAWLRDNLFGEWIPAVADRIESTRGSITELAELLDDPDGDGNPGLDAFGLGNLDIDVTGDIQPRSPSKTYTVTFGIEGSFDPDAGLALAAGDIGVIDGDTDTDAQFSQQVTLKVDLTKPPGAQLTIPDGGYTGSFDLGIDADFGGTDGAANGPDKPALNFTAGGLGLRATGPVQAQVGVDVTIEDPDGDGDVDATEIGNPAEWIDVDCTSGAAHVDLTARASLAGLSSQLGRITLDDADLCDGVDPPTVDLSQMGELDNIDLVELVNGIAQLASALQGIQDQADLDIPFVKESLAGIVQANERLERFFVDNGLTDADNPLARITYNPEDERFEGLDTLDELLPKLGQALGIPSYTPTIVDGKLLFDLSRVIDPAPLTGGGTLDFSDQLSRTGLTDVVGTTKATIDPRLALNLGIGIDLGEDVDFEDRFFFQLAPAGTPELAGDATVTVDAALRAKLGILGIELADTNTTGPITLLERRTATAPMLGVDLKGRGDDRLTLAEIAAPGAGADATVTPTLNARVPAFGLTATAKLAGAPLASGRVDVVWNDLSKLPGQTDGLTVTADAAFTGSLLPFAFDPDNPRATITSFLTAAHTGVSNLRRALVEDRDAVKALPLVGDDLTELDPLLAEIEDGLADLIELDSILTLENAEAEVEELIGDALGVTNDKWPGILTVSVVPRNGTTRAALQAQLNVGICTSPRMTLTGCTAEGPRPVLPLNLTVGTATDSPVAVGADATGEVTVDYDARLSLGLGVELPNVSLATAGELPDTTDLPRLYVVDTTSFELGVGASVSGRFGAVLGPVEVEIGRPAPGAAATASLAARYVLKSRTAVPTAPKRIYADQLASWITTIDPDPTANGGTGIRDDQRPATCTPAAAACATLPIVINDLYAGDITFRAPDLLAPSGWVFDTGTVLDRLSSSDFQFALLVNGLSAFTERLETSLRALPPGRNVPLLGTDPTATADVLEAFRENFVDPAANLVTQLNNAATAGNVRSQVQDFLWTRIGPNSSIKLLKDGPDAGTDVTKADIQVILKCGTATNQTDCADGTNLGQLQDMQIRVSLGKDLEATTEPLDSGFPGLRLRSEEGFTAGVGFTMDLAVGIDRKVGFYIPTSATNQPELRVEATASLPDRISGELALIPVTLDDLNVGRPDVSATVGIDLTSGGPDGKVSIGELTSVGVTPSLQACANVRVGLATGGDARFPRFKADLGLVGGFQCQAGGITGAPATNADIDISFENVRVNAGSFLKDLVSPAAQQLIDFVGPVRPALDALEEPIPGVAEAARRAGRRAPTWWELMELVDSANGGGDDLAMLRKVRFLIQTADALASQPGTGLDDIPLGDFDVDADRAEDPASARDTAGLMEGVIVDSAGSIIDHLNEAGVPLEIVERLEPEPKYHSLTFPAFEDPKRLFGMLLGQDVPLIRFEAGGSFVHVPIGPYTFPVGPATLYLGGGLDVRGHFAAGYDTYGIRQVYSFLTDDDPANDSVGVLAEGLLGGLYVDDFNAQGQDVPELTVRAEVVAGAGVGIPGLGVFAEGGVTGRADVDLKTDQSGKLRIPAAIAQLKINPNPACFFDASAKIEAFVRVVVQNPIEDVAYPIADATILDQPDLTEFCKRPPPGGSERTTAWQYTDGTLDLTRSTTAAADTIRVQQTGPQAFTVVAQGKQEQWTGVTRIFVDGKGGNDTITIEGTTPRPGAAVPVHACGGPGKDRVTASTGKASLHGDTGPKLVAQDNGQNKDLTCVTGAAGNDTLTGGPDGDVITAGGGDDSLIGLAGGDTLKGEGGLDTLMPGAGTDVVDGGDGRDAVSYADRTEGLTITLAPGSDGRAGATGTTEADTLTSLESAVGGSGGDVLGGTGDQLIVDGGPGDDRLTGATGDDLLVGGDGADRILGGEGHDLLLGTGGDDTLIGQLGGDTYRGGDGRDTADYSAEPAPVAVTVGGQQDDGPVAEIVKDDVVDVEVVIGGPGNDRLSTGGRALELLGGAGRDTLTGPGILRGEAGEDTLRGSSARDELYGGTEDDDLRGSGGHDLLDGGPGTDVLDGGFGADDLKGGDGADTADWSTRTNPVYLQINPAANSGEGNRSNYTGIDCNGTRCDRIQLDVERIVGGSGVDELHGNTSSNTLVGGDGGDRLSGGGGVDRFETGPGIEINHVWDEDGVFGVGDGDGGDVVIGGPHQDFVSSGGGDDRYELGAGDDRLQDSEDGDLHIDAGPGNDNLSVEGGDHVIDLGEGDDRYQASNVTGSGPFALTGDAGPGNDVVITEADMAADVTLGDGNDEFDGSGAAVAGDVVDGGPGHDKLNLGSGDDHGTDVEGANTFQGHGGDDVLTAGPGADGIWGGPGEDTISDAGSDDVGRTGLPQAQEVWGGEDDDDIVLTGPTVLNVNVGGDGGDDTITTAGGPQKLLGAAGTDTLSSGPGDDDLNGGDGDDTLLGGDGDDDLDDIEGTNTFDGGLGADTLEGGQNSTDTVTYALRTVPVVVDQGSEPRSDDGSAQDESASDPTRRDHVYGSIDVIVGSPLADSISLSEGTTARPGALRGGGGRDTLVTTYAGSTLEGGADDDSLYGAAGAETLDGGPGHDLIVGGPGPDVERGQAGNDRFDQGTTTDAGDRISGGADTDVADYSARSGAVSVTPGVGGANDGAPGEADDVDATVEQGRTPGTATPTPAIAVTAPATTVVGATTDVTVTVTGVGSTGTPTGTVDVLVDDQRVGSATLDGTGKAIVGVRMPSTGTARQLKATYRGDTRYRSVTSAVRTVAVTKAPTTLVLDVVDSPVKTGTAGSVTFSIAAQGSGYQPSGSVVIKEGATTLATTNTANEGEAVALPVLPVGTHRLTATWAGDGGTEPATSAEALLLVTADGRVPAPTVTVGTTPTAPVAGASTQVKVDITHAAGVTGARPPAGTVTVTATGTAPARSAVTLGAAALASGSATIAVPAGLAAGQWRLDVAYSGSSTTPAATGTRTVTVAGAASRVTVTSSKDPAPVDETVTLTATVARAGGTGALGTGTVVFLDGTVEIGRRPLGTDGTASISRSFTVGQHPITARFEGGDLLAGSTSAVLTQDITTGTSVPAVPTTTTLQRTGDTVVATVAVASGQPAATGTVVFTVDGVARPAIALAGGKATLPLAGLAIGSHTVTAAYQGSDTHAVSASAPLTVTIAAPAPPGAPGTPTVTAAGATTTVVTFSAPTSTGSSPVTGYRVTVTTATGAAVKVVDVTGSPATVTGLVGGTVYRFAVQAVNGAGAGAASAPSAPAVPPFRTLDAFTTQQHRDLAGRAPTSTELASWRSQLTAGTKTPVALVETLLTSAHATPYATITRLYSAYFLRLPGAGELDYWVGELRKGVNVYRLSEGFAKSTEFKNRYGSLTNAAFVRLVYTNVLGRNPSAKEAAYWTGELDRGVTRGKVMVGFSESAENKTRLRGLTDLVTLTRLMLGRAPTVAERQTWETRPRAEVVAWILASAPYDARIP